jgi:restriction system protein
MTTATPLPFWKAAQQVLSEAGEPLDYREITRRALDRSLVATTGATPEATMNAQMAVKIKSLGDRSPFVRTSPGVFGLRAWVDSGKLTASPPEEAHAQIRIPHFPRYAHHRQFLQAINGIPRDDFFALKSEVFNLRGTPQNQVDWSNPDEWIPDRLSGGLKDLATKIWLESKGMVNPRYLNGHWLLASNYDLVESEGALIALTERGQDFLSQSEGTVVQELDVLEGLGFILKLVAERGPATRAELTEPFTEFAYEVSKLRADTSINSFLWARLRNLIDRGFIERRGKSYSSTPQGVAWLDQLGTIGPGPDVPDETQQVLRLVQDQRRKVREQIRQELSDMDPYAFEHLVKSILQKMDYEDVQVTSKGGDGGVDVLARIQLGITDVREVVQVKRHQKNIQRHVLDALRGSLHRFNAVRGTIITLSDFAKGTKDAAFEPGAAPITLIDGEKLVDLMIEHRVGVKKKPLELLELDLDSIHAAAETAENDDDE